MSTTSRSIVKLSLRCNQVEQAKVYLKKCDLADGLEQLSQSILEFQVCTAVAHEDLLQFSVH